MRSIPSLSAYGLNSMAARAVELQPTPVADCKRAAAVYEHLVFEGCEHLSIRSLPGMAERTLRIGSAGKTFSLTAWKVRVGR